MKTIFYLLTIIIFCSCTNDKKDAPKQVISTPTGLQGLQKTATAPTQTAPKALIFNPKHGEPGHTCALAEGAPLNQNVVPQPQQTVNAAKPVNTPITTTAVSDKKLNPAHGKPGHRCDLAVGAPLDSKPVQITSPVNNKPIITTATVNQVAKGMNPPHGQPNHRCDIAVGAPLNSKPVQAAAVTTTPTPPVTPIETITSTGQPGAKLNPKHGEPGHRCDIAVGAPLS